MRTFSSCMNNKIIQDSFNKRIPSVYDKRCSLQADVSDRIAIHYCSIRLALRCLNPKLSRARDIKFFDMSWHP
jgi:hypothetical protein